MDSEQIDPAQEIAVMTIESRVSCESDTTVDTGQAPQTVTIDAEVASDKATEGDAAIERHLNNESIFWRCCSKYGRLQRGFFFPTDECITSLNTEIHGTASKASYLYTDKKQL